jgi:hypothetical protein
MESIEKFKDEKTVIKETKQMLIWMIRLLTFVHLKRWR